MTTYRQDSPVPGHKGCTISIWQHGLRGPAVLLLGDGCRDDLVDIIDQLNKAHQRGREERSGEILGDAGLARATSEVGLHRQQGIAMPGQVAACKCGRFEGGSIADWQQHLACEVLRAAARLPR